MSGIFGFTLQCGNQDKVLRRMGKLQEHRGPDGEDYFINQSIGMGIRILGNIDNRQPGHTGYGKRNRLMVFCDGKICNYDKMRAELSKKGYAFTTNNDSEIIASL